MVSVIISQNITATGNTRENSETRYLFYLHGRIVEEQGADAFSEEYGPYKYNEIISTLDSIGYQVISEVRKKNCDPLDYAYKVKSQIDSLINNGVDARNITVLGASKGAFIVIQVSNLMQNKKINYVLLSIFSDRIFEILQKTNVRLSGRILYIYDYKDTICGSGKDFIDELKGENFSEFKEIELKMGLGHGILYKVYNEWLSPLQAWTKLK